MTNEELDRLQELRDRASVDYGQDNVDDRMFYETAYERLPDIIAAARRKNELESMLLEFGKHSIDTSCDPRKYAIEASMIISEARRLASPPK